MKVWTTMRMWRMSWIWFGWSRRGAGGRHDAGRGASCSQNPSHTQGDVQSSGANGGPFFAESFDRGTLDGWVQSNAKKEDADEEIAKYDGKWAVEEMKDSKLPGDKGLVLKSRAKHHAISASCCDLSPLTPCPSSSSTK
ncbi:hypothetical protein INR49_022665 [Caranx melampygus]|nr:hypothetical protein INR49_022665 [Caranx melampygus]